MVRTLCTRFAEVHNCALEVRTVEQSLYVLATRRVNLFEHDASILCEIEGAISYLLLTHRRHCSLLVRITHPNAKPKRRERWNEPPGEYLPLPLSRQLGKL